MVCLVSGSEAGGEEDGGGAGEAVPGPDREDHDGEERGQRPVTHPLQVQYSTVQYSTVQYSTVQYSTQSHIPSRTEREVSEFKKLNREKSFDEARTAVQSQIEKIFQKVRSEAIDTNNPVNTSRVTCHQSAHRAPAQLEYSFGPLSSPNI